MSGNSASSNISNVKIEQIVLGAILMNEENYWAVHDILSIDMFGSEDHQKIYAIIYELASDGKAIRVPIVAGRIGGLSDGKDAEAYTSMLLHVASREDSIPLSDYALELRSSATRRKLIALGESIVKAAQDVKYDPDQIADRASERLSDISRSAAIEQESTVSGVFAKIAESYSTKGSGVVLRPCLIGLEEMVGTFRPGSLVLWGGAPGSGKTAIAMQQMLFSSTVHPTSLFELEMDSESLVTRSTSGQTGVSLRNMANGLTEAQYKALMKAKADFASLKMTIVHPAKMTIQQIRSRAYAHKRKYGLDLLAVDHIKLVERQTKNRMDPVERAYENARDLKALAKDLGCVVIGLCQFTKAARQKEHPEPEMEDFYGGSLEEHADLMLANFNRNDWHNRNPPVTKQGKAYEEWLSNKNSTAGKIEVYKLKDRFGPPRDRRIFEWDGASTVFRDQASQTALFDDAITL
ncbi:replicative DNA helicase [Ancylobacter sp. 3268]|uniref:replicative DNA helicase n=1 Tax=Ancylobacter sp. 3268 TaxID=2817752 RepID=UPI00285CCDBD|nr:DnaB-like helicase C-terminal domain-containing protein [Ancylobacter sp. 3268]MDR6954175.1 replicative DNA helicase [Ancylobacter sp. 3268]